MGKAIKSRRFLLYRKIDETGISGAGVVAEGIQWTCGKCSLCWLTDVSSVAVYDSLDDVIAIHGHGGKTIIAWLEPLDERKDDFCRGQSNAIQDGCEGCTLSSVGGDLENMVAPQYSPPLASEHAYLEGYLSGYVLYANTWWHGKSSKGK